MINAAETWTAQTTKQNVELLRSTMAAIRKTCIMQQTQKMQRVSVVEDGDDSAEQDLGTVNNIEQI